MLLISTGTFGFESNEDFEEEKRNLEAEKENKQIKKKSIQNKNQSYKAQHQQNFLKRRNDVQPLFLQEEKEIN